MEHRILGDYTILKPVGQGTLGMVFLAEHRFMKKHYILKILPEELATDRNFIQRFEEEISVLSALDHANIVKVYNVSFAQGVYFLVTDCIVDDFGETTNLAKYLNANSKNLDEDELFHILRQVASALDYAHTKKIGLQDLVHRSLKLSNILIGKKKESVHIYLSDFGLSRIIGAGAVINKTIKNAAEALNIVSSENFPDRYPNPPYDQNKLAQLHTAFLQNYAFLAPEQKKLEADQLVNKYADVYAFGILTYFLLMHDLPEGLFDMPSSQSAFKYNWDIVVQNCLQKIPEKRANGLIQLLDEMRFQNKKSSIKLKEDIVDVKQESLLSIEPVLNSIKDTNFFTQPTLTPFVVEAVAPYVLPNPAPVPINSLVTELESVDSAAKLSTLSSQEAAAKKIPILQTSHLQRPTTDLDPGAIFQTTSSVKAYNPEPKDIANVKPLMTEMVVIEGGTFYRGSKDGNRDEMPRHPITLNSFAIDIHPVTNEQFVRFLEIMGGEKDSNHNDIIRLRDSRIKRGGGKLSIESGYAKHPVVGVTWYGAVAYAKWIGKRLPTEAEWEVAARGTFENALYPTGDDIEKNQANFFSSDTTAVMSYLPTGYNLYDMPGNVYEWCHDWYGYNYYEISVQEPDNPQGPLQGVYRVLRGGCWKSLREDLRCSRRHRNNPGTVNGTYGFRCAADVQS